MLACKLFGSKAKLRQIYINVYKIIEKLSTNAVPILICYSFFNLFYLFFLFFTIFTSE